VTSDNWLVLEPKTPGGPVHIIPDGERHAVNGDPCACMPRETAPGLFLHNAFDARELGEVLHELLDTASKAMEAHNHDWTDDDRDAFDHAERLLQLHWPQLG
jgi:hypothetical protein